MQLHELITDAQVKRAFTRAIAKLHPEYAPYAEYDQLMRRDEWYGREN